MNINFKYSLKTITLVCSLVLFLISLSQKSYCTTVQCDDSFAVLISGTFGFFLSFPNLAWLANPFLLISWLYIDRKPMLSIRTSAIATIFSFSFFLFATVLDNTNGDLNEIISYKLGYWLWISSISIMFIGNMVSYYLKPPTKSVALSKKNSGAGQNGGI